MMNKILKTFLMVSIILGYQMFFFVQYASDRVYEVLIEDDANLLTTEEENKLKEEMTPLAEYGNIIFKSSNFYNSSTADLARDYYHNHFGTSSGTVFYIDMYNREIYVFSDGYNYEVITSGKALSITDNVYRNASKGEYYKCTSRAYAQMYILLSAKSSENISLRLSAFFRFQEPMKWICNAILAMLTSSFILFLIIFGKYKVEKRTQKEIINTAHRSLKFRYFDASVSNVEKVYRSHDSDGYSGGSSSGGSSSSSSGGGGGHSF